jgi:hypothetical protein
MWSANLTNNFFIIQNLTTCFGPYEPSSGDNYRNDIRVLSKILILLQYIHYIHDYEAYLLLLNLYLYNIQYNHYDSYHLKMARRGRIM